jgi:GR25 family glycosyltransferase involved in LPS biosynthesis
MNKANVVLFTFIKTESIDSILSIIVKYMPEKLYLVMDQPRNSEDESHQELLKKKIENVANQLTINYLIPEKHIGISGIFDFALDNIFQEEERIIILEDDTVPSFNFFQFCNQQLEIYQNNNDVTSVLGTNMMKSNSDKNEYFIATFGFPFWGWATWKSKWLAQPRTDDFFEMVNSNNNKLNEMVQTFVQTKGMNISWDVRWCLYQYLNNFKVVIPSQNMITNTGFNQFATFTKNQSSVFKELPLQGNESENWKIMDNENSKLVTEEYINQTNLKIKLNAF